MCKYGISFFFFVCILPIPHSGAPSVTPTPGAAQLIIWNVGQGSWATEVHSDFCLHFDMGGEKNPTPQVLRLCQKKNNYLHLSHWDLDHISFVGSFTKHLKKVCLSKLPLGKTSSQKQKRIDKVSICTESETRSIRGFVRKIFSPWNARNSNDLSEILYSTAFQVVFPGDSSKAQEKHWRELAPIRSKGLILGHHGSNTSTSKDLLKQLPYLKWAAASARHQRYQHPHWKVVELLNQHRIPLLKTEDWGHLHFLKGQ